MSSFPRLAWVCQFLPPCLDVIEAGIRALATGSCPSKALIAIASKMLPSTHSFVVVTSMMDIEINPNFHRAKFPSSPRLSIIGCYNQEKITRDKDTEFLAISCLSVIDS